MTVLKQFLGGRVIVKVGDLTQEDADAIVNAANHSLLGGGGVDGAIHRAGGAAILEECRKIRSERYPDGLPAGEAVMTGGGKLPARSVIHTVGPVWHGGKGEDEKLANCYLNSLRLAEAAGSRTIAFPAISTGVYRFPKDRAARIASSVIRDHVLRSALKEVRFVFFSSEDAEIFLANQKFEGDQNALR